VVIQKRKSSYLPSEPTEADRKARAERLARNKAERDQDAPKAMQDYRAAEAAVKVKTAKLRAERIAREAAAKKKRK
jgi:hypothetical protein